MGDWADERALELLSALDTPGQAYSLVQRGARLIATALREAEQRGYERGLDVAAARPTVMVHQDDRPTEVTLRWPTLHISIGDDGLAYCIKDAGDNDGLWQAGRHEYDKNPAEALAEIAAAIRAKGEGTGR